jgi:hypothetical protein
MKLKDIFKIAVVGAAGWAGGQIAGPIGKKIGGALAGSLMGTGGMGSGLGGGRDASQYRVQAPNLRQFSMPLRLPAGSAQTVMPQGALQVNNAEALQVQWESRLNRYLLRRKALSERTVVKV